MVFVALSINLSIPGTSSVTRTVQLTVCPRIPPPSSTQSPSTNGIGDPSVFRFDPVLHKSVQLVTTGPSLTSVLGHLTNIYIHFTSWSSLHPTVQNIKRFHPKVQSWLALPVIKKSTSTLGLYRVTIHKVIGLSLTHTMRFRTCHLFLAEHSPRTYSTF